MSLKGIGQGKIDTWIKKLEEIHEESAVEGYTSPEEPASVGGARSVDGTIPVAGAETIENSASIEGAVSVEGGAGIDGAVPINGAVSASAVKDHRTQPNSYWSKWGKDEGEKRIITCSAMNKYCCITELAMHIVEQSEVLFKGTDHEGKWFFFHDALTTMTSAETITWMKSKDYLKYWILPQRDRLINTRYHNKLPGDSPELMPMDATLNKDIDDSGKQHVAVTSHLEWSKDYKDQRKFSLATPCEGMYLYMYI